MGWIILGVLIGVALAGYAVYRWRSQSEKVIDTAANTVNDILDK